MKKINYLKPTFMILLVALCLLLTACSDSSDKILPPDMNSAVYNDDGSIAVVWGYEESSDGYEIYRADDPDGEYVLAGTAEADAAVYYDRDIELYKTYYYKVKKLIQEESSDFSEMVSAYAEGTPVENPDMEFRLQFPEGEDCRLAGDGVTTTFCPLPMVVAFEGWPTDDYEVFYDRSMLEIRKGVAGNLTVVPKEAGNYLLTFVMGEEKGTFVYNAETAAEGPIQFTWNQSGSEENSMSVKIPQNGESVLTMKRGWEEITDFEVSVSDSSICTAEKEGSQVILKALSPGKCELRVKSQGNTTVFHWLIRGGKATAGYESAYGIPIAKSISKDAAEAAIEGILSLKHTDAQIETWVKDGTDFKDWIEKVETPAEAVQLLNATGYTFNHEKYEDDTLTTGWLEDQGLEWAFKWTPERNFKEGFGMCQGISNLMNALLKNDFQEQGYVKNEDNGGGHCFNYFKVNDLYVMCDFAGIPNRGIFGHVKYPADTTAYIIFVASTPEEFAEYYINYGHFADDFRNPEALGYLHHLYMYPMEGVANAAAWDGTTPEEENYWPYLPIEWNGQKMEDIMINLYVEEGYEYYFRQLPDQSRWPEWSK